MPMECPINATVNRYHGIPFGLFLFKEYAMVHPPWDHPCEMPWNFPWNVPWVIVVYTIEAMFLGFTYVMDEMATLASSGIMG